MNELHFFSVDMKYISKLHSVDENVMSVSPQIGKEMRPFVGVIVLLNGKNYCIPLTSPKDKFDKKSNIDFIKILDVGQKDKNGAPKIIGILNINNMIPIHREAITKIDLSFSQKDSINDRKRKSLMQDQLKWCRANAETIIRRANKVHDMIVLTPEKNKNLTRRCCDFKKLEAVLDKMMKRQKTADPLPTAPKPKKH